MTVLKVLIIETVVVVILVLLLVVVLHVTAILRSIKKRMSQWSFVKSCKFPDR